MEDNIESNGILLNSINVATVVIITAVAVVLLSRCCFCSQAKRTNDNVGAFKWIAVEVVDDISTELCIICRLESNR